MLAELKSLALMRRALHVLYAEGLPDTVTAFAKRIGADASTASRIRADCQTEGFLKEDTPVDNNHTGTSQRSHKKGAAKKVRRGTAKAKLVVNKSYEMRKLKNERYFRPGEGREKEITLSWNKVAQTAEEESAQSVDVSMVSRASKNRTVWISWLFTDADAHVIQADAAQGRENATPSNMSANCKDGPSDEQEGRDHIDTPAEAEAVDQSAATHGDGQPEAQPEMNESIEESMLMLTPEQQRHGANLSAGMMTPAATEPRAPPALIETAGRSTHTSPAGPSSEKAPPATPVKPTFKPIFGRKGKGRAQDTEMANHFMTGSALVSFSFSFLLSTFGFACVTLVWFRSRSGFSGRYAVGPASIIRTAWPHHFDWQRGLLHSRRSPCHASQGRIEDAPTAHAVDFGRARAFETLCGSFP